MTPQEREQLTQFLKQLAEARVGEKNTEADGLIREVVAKQPDAAYLLVQRAMLVEQALNTAKAQIAQLQSQLQAQSAPAGGRNTGFLGGGNPWGQSLDSGAANAGGGVPGAGGYQIPRGGAPFANAAPAAPSGGGVGSFLGSMATTAAGVVAGSFLFQGIENLIGGHHGPSSSLWGDGSPVERVSEQTIINNYYETPPDGELARNDDWSQDDVGSFLADNDADPFFSDNDDGDDSSWT
jgi:hypothetical protein